MNRPTWIERERALLRRLPEIVSDRARTEAELAREIETARQAIEQRFAAEQQAARTAYEQAMQRLSSQYQAQRQADERDHPAVMQTLEETQQTQSEQVRQAWQATKDKLDREYQMRREEIEREFTTTCQRLRNEAETATRQAQQEFDRARADAERFRRETELSGELEATRRTIEQRFAGEQETIKTACETTIQQLMSQEEAERRSAQAKHAQAEQQLQQTQQAQSEKTQQEYEARKRKLDDDHHAQRRQIVKDFEKACQRLRSEAETATRQAQQEFEQACATAAERTLQNQQASEACDLRKQSLQLRLELDLAGVVKTAAEARQRSEKEYERTRVDWETNSLKFQARCKELQEKLDALQGRSWEVFSKHGAPDTGALPPSDDVDQIRAKGDSTNTVSLLLEGGQRACTRLESFSRFASFATVALIAVYVLAGLPILFVLLRDGKVLASTVAFVGWLVGGPICWFLLKIPINRGIDSRWTKVYWWRKATKEMLERILQPHLAPDPLKESRTRKEREVEQIEQDLQKKQADLRQKHTEAVRQLEAERDRKLLPVNEPSPENHAHRLREIEQRRDEAIGRATQDHDSRLAEADQDCTTKSNQAWLDCQTQQDEIRLTHGEQRQQAVNALDQRLAELASALATSRQAAEQNRRSNEADSQARRKADLEAAEARYHKGLQEAETAWRTRLPAVTGSAPHRYNRAAVAPSPEAHAARLSRITAQRDEELRRATEHHDRCLAKAEADYTQKSETARRESDAQQEQIRLRYETQSKEEVEGHQQRTSSRDAQYETQCRQIEEQRDQSERAARQRQQADLTSAETRHAQAMETLRTTWHDNLTHLHDESVSIVAEVSRYFPDWKSEEGSAASRSTGPASGAGQHESAASRSTGPASGAGQHESAASRSTGPASGAGQHESAASRSTGPASGAGQHESAASRSTGPASGAGQHESAASRSTGPASGAGEPWQRWRPTDKVPEMLRIGRLPAALALLPDGLSSDETLRDPQRESYPLPAIISFPDRCSLLLTATGAGQDRAIAHLRAIALRILTALPPGKARFTFIDPVALGEHFAPFLHLADHDETLVSGRVWTEPRQIEQQLETLAEHMTNVIQKYLRGQFKTISDYNARAGEVAEPYRFLVVAGFPAGFSPDALRRLQSIITAGPRCGINTLLLIDRALELPAGFDLDGLRRHLMCFHWQQEGERFVWQDDDFARWPLELEEPPDMELFNRILMEVGSRTRDGNVVRVPFENIAPAQSRWWSADSRSELVVPLGRAGAVRLQELRLGKGVAQHVLIAGKTGSGKSTLLHALIVNLALHYSPQEVQFYLVDFKKGVEFKPYALHELPHARVIAIESEREFGVSVLQRLDREMHARGELFRQHNVAGLEAYRNLGPDKQLPRILLLVDEFQEFFVEDDRVAREASLLLDRLVRQGRAFGIHIVLGSQTLAGAYTLARATIGQMAVRIALQCSDADGRLILGEDNGGAKLLTRPGQAIHNDANGAEASNNVFQTAWLPDEQRELYLEHLKQLARERNQKPLGQVVFEGNVSPEVGLNRPLYELLTCEGERQAPRAAKAWLGEPVAIADPVSAVFERQSGSNLVTAGCPDDAALGMALSAVVGLLAQLPRTEPPAVRLYLVNGLPFEERHQPLLELVGRLPIRWANRREGSAVVGEVAAEVDRRINAGGEPGAPLYLLLLGVQHLRDLRRNEEEMGSFRGGGSSPARQLGHILREGPGLGVFTLMWSDTLAGVQRCLDRQGLREFALRVALQMNAADSTTLIDSPLASKLGAYAALFYNEQLGRLDKFRPYGLPERTWLAWAVGQLLPAGGTG